MQLLDIRVQDIQTSVAFEKADDVLKGMPGSWPFCVHKHDREPAALPLVLILDFAHGNVELAADSVGQAAQYVPFVFERETAGYVAINDEQAYAQCALCWVRRNGFSRTRLLLATLDGRDVPADPAHTALACAGEACPGDFLDSEELQDVTFMKVVDAFDADTALEAGIDFLDIVFESLE